MQEGEISWSQGGKKRLFHTKMEIKVHTTCFYKTGGEEGVFLLMSCQIFSYDWNEMNLLIYYCRDDLLNSNLSPSKGHLENPTTVYVIKTFAPQILHGQHVHVNYQNQIHF